jgi:broad specificity phosphatase PhoE
MIIKLIRHGRSLGNEEPMTYVNTPDHEIPLTDEGIKQAVALANDLEMFETDNRGEYGYLDIYCSPYTRAMDTAITFLTEKQQTRTNIKIDHRLREQDWGKPENMEHHAQLLNVHFNNRYYGKTAISENGTMVLDRIHSFIDKIALIDKDCLIFTHGVVINAFKTIINGYSIEQFENLGYVGNCSITTLEI